MRLRPAVGLLFLVCAVTLGAASPALAWTRTVVHSARATVEVERAVHAIERGVRAAGEPATHDAATLSPLAARLRPAHEPTSTRQSR